MRIFTSAILAACFFFAASVSGHEAKGPNGGQIVDAGDYHVELVAKGSNVEVFVTDAADKPVGSENLKGLAILTVSGKSHRIELASSGGNKLQGQANVPLQGNPKGVVRLTFPGGKTAQGQYK